MILNWVQVLGDPHRVQGTSLSDLVNAMDVLVAPSCVSIPFLLVDHIGIVKNQPSPLYLLLDYLTFPLGVTGGSSTLGTNLLLNYSQSPPVGNTTTPESQGWRATKSLATTPTRAHFLRTHARTHAQTNKQKNKQTNKLRYRNVRHCECLTWILAFCTCSQAPEITRS